MFQEKKSKKGLFTKRVVRYALFSLLTVLFAGRLSAQDHEWWANNVNWDGKTNWSRYIISSPRFMGPNALPIQLQNDGLIAQRNTLLLSGNFHFTEGDQTQNPRLSFDYILVPEVISFQLSMVPFEHFSMSHAIKTERKIFHLFYDREFAIGDVQLHTNIQILEQVKHAINARLRIAYRFPTSSLQGAARFTDAPGYYFDIGLGKAFAKNNFQIYPSIMMGFYVWQTNRADQFQNDAFLYGAAIDLKWKAYRIHSSFRGYAGYLDDGDRPATVDMQFARQFSDFEVFLGGGIGLWDNLYDRLELGANYQF